MAALLRNQTWLASLGLALGLFPSGVIAAAFDESRISSPQVADAFIDSRDLDEMPPEPFWDGEVNATTEEGEEFSEFEFSGATLRQLMRPGFRFVTEWQAETDGVKLSLFEAGMRIPTYPIFGPPPPFVSPGFAYTKIESPVDFGLPSDLYDASLGLAWMRTVNDRWVVRFMFGSSFATDGENTSSDAWRFRGGVFAVYRRCPEWTWTFGALALGRNDIPVVPAVGLIHQPSPGLRFELMLPRPRIAFLLADRGERQSWGYVGAALNGSTWGVQRADGQDDQLTYGDFRAVLGWESTPTPEPGIPFTRGRKLGLELGYAFSRDFEFESDESKIKLDDTFLLRGSMSF